MVCEWTGDYLYQPGTVNKNDYDVVCDAIIDYVKTYGSEHNLSSITSEAEGWEVHAKPIKVKQYNVVIDGETVPIERIAEEIIANYEDFMNDEASDFGKNAYCIGEPWSKEDLEIFTRENMIEYWS